MNYFTDISRGSPAVRLAREPAWRARTIVIILPSSRQALSFHNAFYLDRIIEICQSNLD